MQVQVEVFDRKVGGTLKSLPVPYVGFFPGLLILGLAGFHGSLAGQVLAGRTLDERSGQPVPGVSLEILDDLGEVIHSTLSNEAGEFSFSDLDPGHYRLRGERIGYRESVSRFLALEEGDQVELEFRMAVEAILLEPLTVTASPRPWYEHLKPPALWDYYERKDYLEPLGVGRFMDQEDLKPLAGLPVSLAIGTIAGMQAVGSEHSPTRFHVLGRRGCDVEFFLNGMPVRLRAPRSRADTADVDFVPGPEPMDWYIDDFVALSDVEAIEVYRGPSELPGEFHGMHSGGNCGAVVVWTKRSVQGGSGGRPDPGR